MNKTKSVNLDGGFGLGGLVFLVLLVLKLTGVAQLSWFWVFFPLWIIPALFLALSLFILFGYVIAKLIAPMPGRRMKGK